MRCIKIQVNSCKDCPFLTYKVQYDDSRYMKTVKVCKSDGHSNDSLINLYNGCPFPENKEVEDIQEDINLDHYDERW